MTASPENHVTAHTDSSSVDIFLELEKENGYSSGVGDIPENSEFGDESDGGLGIPNNHDDDVDKSGDYEFPDDIPIASEHSSDEEVESEKESIRREANLSISDHCTNKE